MEQVFLFIPISAAPRSRPTPRDVASDFSVLCKPGTRSEHRGTRTSSGVSGTFSGSPCQADRATVVNNCAAALVLIVRHFIRKKPEIVISRGEMVQIGGGFRIGEILESTGAKLREVGATNKTTVTDYARAISEKTALILKVHRSNFFMSGFVASPSSAETGCVSSQKPYSVCSGSR